jgi:hypothetical protein
VALGAIAQAAVALPNEAGIEREIVELRSSSSKTYLRSDGNYEWVGYPSDICYRDANGSFKDIENGLVNDNTSIDKIDYVYKNKANQFQLRFSDNAANEYLVNLGYQGKSISLGYANANESVPLQKEAFDNRIVSELVEVGNAIIYPNVSDGVDLIYESNTYGFKEIIVLNKPLEQNQFLFNVKADGLLIKSSDRGIVFTDTEGKEIFRTQNLYAVDSGGNMTENVKCALVENSGTQQLMITVDKSYLSDKARTYPVLIDPSIMVTGATNTYDSYVASNYGGSNYYLQTTLRVGYNSTYGNQYTFIKFNIPTNIPPNNIWDAYIRLEKYDGTTLNNVKASRVTGNWASSTITWNNKPGTSSDYQSDTGYNDSGSWYRFGNLGGLVQAWMRQTHPNYGVMIKQENATQATRYYSSDASSPHKPELYIVFSSYTYFGSRPYDGSGFSSANCAGYAFDENLFLNKGDIDLQDQDMAAAYNDMGALLQIIKNHFDAWLAANKPNEYVDIGSYNSTISADNYRVVMRVGWLDKNNNGRIDFIGDSTTRDIVDYHFWYQTKDPNGYWAEKLGSMTQHLLTVDGETNPYYVNWYSPFGYNFYNSVCEYYAMYHPI